MITAQQIRVLANKHQTTELNIKREYFQHVFLSYFYQQPQTSAIYFKGGTALRIFYQSPRFSEDLDLSSTIKDKSQIEQALLQTIYEVSKEAVEIELKEAKTTSGGYLATINFNQAIEVLLQISLRETKKTGEVITVISDFVPPYSVVGLAQKQLVDEKIRALITRQKPRDFYDLYFILRANLLPPSQKSILPKVLKLLREVDINFEQELKLFLPKNHWAIIRDFKVALEREVKKSIL